MSGNDAGNFELLDMITIISFAMQVMNYQEIKQQSTTDDLMRELRKQDKAYLEKILENQNKILSILSEMDLSAK